MTFPTKVTSLVCSGVATALMLYGLVSQTTQAQLLAYEPFDYETGDFLAVAGGALGGGTGWADINGDGNDGWQDEGVDPYDADRVVVEDAPAGWGYTDSQGNSLPTAGRVLNVTDWEGFRRHVDLSGVDPSLLANTADNPLDPIEKMGVDGTSVWISFLGLGTESGGQARSAEIGTGESFLPQPPDFPDPRGFDRSIMLGRPWKLNTSGGQNPEFNDAWGVLDTGPSTDTVASTGDSFDEKVFFVARINFGAGPFVPTLGVFDETVDIWTNPDLGPTAPADADRKISDFVFYSKNFNAIQIGGNADTFFDEIRIGLDYASVAPIAPDLGLLADFDSDNDVDGRDFLDWQRGFGTTYDATDLANWQTEYGINSPPLVATTAVPEPGSLLLLGTLALMMAGGRRAGTKHWLFSRYSRR